MILERPRHRQHLVEQQDALAGPGGQAAGCRDATAEIAPSSWKTAVSVGRRRHAGSDRQGQAVGVVGRGRRFVAEQDTRTCG